MSVDIVPCRYADILYDKKAAQQHITTLSLKVTE